MIGTVLHLWGRVVDRVAGADAARLRVTLAALSARVAAAEGEAARLRADAEAATAQWFEECIRLKRRANEAMDVCDRLGKERDEARAEVERLTRERTEAPRWRGVAASVEREAAEDRARLEEAIRERDAARAEVERLAQDRDRLKALASDLINDLQSSNEEGPWRCEHCRIRLATIDDDGNGDECCDECAPITEEVLPPTHYADAWRALIKAVRS